MKRRRETRATPGWKCLFRRTGNPSVGGGGGIGTLRLLKHGGREQQFFKKTTHLFHTERRKAKRENWGSHDDRVSDELRGWVSVSGGGGGGGWGMINQVQKHSKRGIVFFTKSSSMIQTAKTWKNHIRAGWRRLSCHVKKSVTPINLMSGVKKIYLIEDNSKNLFLFLRPKNF
jgi:hypothetical protein